MRIVITAGPTREPIDPVRYIGNRSSGQMGAALVTAALEAGHDVTLIAGRVSATFPQVRRIDIETAAQMQEAVIEQFPAHDLLIMAAAVADFRPRSVSTQKLGRSDSLIIECESTPDIVAAAARSKRVDQRVIGFSLESAPGIERAKEKLRKKGLDMIVLNAMETMDSPTIRAALIYPDGRTEALNSKTKADFAVFLLSRVGELFGRSGDEVGDPVA
jgi:phosphopantothenoylcysteine decarboxylase/phosphopantothenate--cysteine ligase